MKINDYILKEDIFKLSNDEYENFRRYLRFLGHKVTKMYGRPKSAQYENRAVILDHDGDLGWHDYIGDGDQITLEEVRKMAMLSM